MYAGGVVSRLAVALDSLDQTQVHALAERDRCNNGTLWHMNSTILEYHANMNIYVYISIPITTIFIMCFSYCFIMVF